MPRRDDDEEDDRPHRRARRRDDDDDDDDDRPRKRRGRDDDEDDLPPDTPRVYVHKRCKEQTEMPAEVIAEYLENPFELGETPTTYCTGCERNVPWKDCHWTETRQNLYEYIDDRRAEMVISGTDPRPNPPDLNWLQPIVVLVGGVLMGLGFAAGAGLSKALFAAIGAVVGLVGGVVWMFVDRVQGARGMDAWNRQLVKRYYKRHPEAQAKKKRRPRDDD